MFKKLTTLIAITLLSGCTALTTVEFSLKCKELRGRVGESCVLKVPTDADVHINGENIEITRYGNE